MKIYTKDLTGPVLNWAVAKADTGLDFISPPKYSTDWTQGGPIIEREQIDLQCYPIKSGGLVWRTFHADGPTPLIAAMRCYVASRLGDEVDVPEGLQ